MRDDDQRERDDRGDGDALRGVDLGAWAPPPLPPAGALADAVIARMREPAGVPAREPAGRGARRRWWIAAAAGAAVGAAAAAAALLIVRGGAERLPAAGHGEVFAARAEHLELGPSSAELEPGAGVRWRREGRRIEVAQPRGGVLWRVAAQDQIVIDAGAAVASVEASGASLRVEVQMNQSDAKVIGTSAATAAAVALVAVIVYQGHVNVTSAGKSVVVEPGQSFELRPRETAPDAPVVGAAPESVDSLRKEIRELQQRLLAAEEAIAGRDEGAPAGAPVQTPPSQTTRSPSPPPPSGACDSEELAEKGKERFALGQLAAALKLFEQAYACKPQAHFAEKAFVAACNMASVPSARLHWKRLTPMSRQRALGICIRNGITADQLNDPGGSRATLQISSRPPATVFVDGNEVGTSPLELQVLPGRHKVMFQVGVDKYSFTVTAKEGETVTLSKSF